MPTESSYSGSNLAVYSDPYADNVPLTDRHASQSYAYNPWNLQSNQQTPSDMPPPGFVPNSDRLATNIPPMDQQKKRQIIPWFTVTVSVIQVIVFVSELIVMHKYTGSIIATKPTFNPMIGPSTYLLIHMGGRFTPCMHYISGVTDVKTKNFPCASSTTVATNVCTLSELCGMGGVSDHPNQWWRFITPMFLHAGFIHIIANMLLQLQLGGSMERDIGTLKFASVYVASGICGFLLGGNFAPDGIVSTGASGALFGIIALRILDLLLNWQLYERPKRALMSHLIEIVIAFALGLLPGIDNFAHIGGFAMGILLGLVLLRSPLKLRERTGQPIANDYYPKSKTLKDRFQNLKAVFSGRHPAWYLWVIVRLVMLVLAATFVIVLIRLFNKGGGHCGWCKYLSCLPVKGWCDAYLP
ncbi:rhomboid family-domain-containing protein [Lipomyces chichibuensis]|uniref:rhomboid family-domain-containing protein n=1 Tax=Lipomyces chichibuensis TaxID=1546026 RepID=UPI00334345C4